jgi:hypothetical protein
MKSDEIFGFATAEHNKKVNTPKNSLQRRSKQSFSLEPHLILIANGRDRNWLEFLAVLDATLPPASLPAPVDSETREKVTRTQEFFTVVENEDGLKDRSASLALLELENRALAHGLAQGW